MVFFFLLSSPSSSSPSWSTAAETRNPDINTSYLQLIYKQSRGLCHLKIFWPPAELQMVLQQAQSENNDPSKNTGQYLCVSSGETWLEEKVKEEEARNGRREENTGLNSDPQNS